MDRNREAKRSTMAASNGLSRRRPRSNGIRYSLEEDEDVEMQETARIQDRAEKRDRDPDFSNRSKKKRGDKFSQRINKEGEESTEESWVDEDEYETQEGKGASQRKSLPVGRVMKQTASSVKVTDELIAVSVPRKARSASMKRSFESSALWYGEYQNQKCSSSSPGSRRVEAASPCSSGVSVRKKTKPSRAKTRLGTQSQSSSSGQEDIEIEVAEVLFGLMRQSQISKEYKNEISMESELENPSAVRDDRKPSGSSPVASSGQNNRPASDSLIEVAEKKRKMEAEESSFLLENGSNAPAIEFEVKHYDRLEKSSGYEDEVGERILKQSKQLTEESGCDDESEDRKQQSISPEDKSILSTKMDVDFQDMKMTEGVSIIWKGESHEGKLKIDLMAPPLPDRDGFMDSKLGIQDSETKGSLIKDEEKVVKEEEKMETVGENRQLLTLDLEKQPNQEGQKQDQTKTILPQMEQIGQASSVPLPMAVGSWSNGQVLLSQPRPKRCTTHHYIARKIHLHQQFIKTDNLCGSNPKNLKIMSSAENMIIGNPLQRMPVLNRNSAQEKGQVVGNISNHIQRDIACETTNLTNTAQRKQFVFQQASHPSVIPSDHLAHDRTFTFSMSQQQKSVGPPGNPSGLSKSYTSIDNSSLFDNSVTGVSAKSTTLPTVVSFTYPNSTASEAPYLTIMPNNVYPFSISAPAIKQENPAQALPLFNGSLYPSHVFHPSQLQHQQARQNSSASSGSSSSHKQPQKQHQTPNQSSHKLESDANRETPLLVDTRGSRKGTYGQTSITPISQMSFTMMPSMTPMGISSGIGNQCEMQQLKSLKSGVELVPPQAFAMAFPSSKNCTASNLNFSYLPQNHSVFQSLPDHMGRPGYQTVAAPKKNHQVSEGKTPTPNGQILVFDNSTRNLNFTSSSMAVNWPPIATPSNALQHPRQQSVTRSKSPTNKTLPASSIAAKFSNNPIIFPGTVQNNSASSSGQASHWKSSTRNPSSSQAPPTCNSSSLNTLLPRTAPQVQTQISFVQNSKAILTPQGQQIPNGIGSSSSGSKQRTSSTGGKVSSPDPLKQSESSSGGSGQKSSPVCGRNVPSILSACPNYLSELKY